MKSFSRLPIFFLVLTSLVFTSCSTMQEYEAARKARLLNNLKTEKKAAVLARKEKVEAAKKIEAPVELPPVDVYASLDAPTLSGRVAKLEELDALITAYTSHADTVAALIKEIQAFGAKSRLNLVERLRLGNAAWKAYWQNFRIVPADEALSKKQVLEFYDKLTVLDATYIKNIEEMNILIQKEKIPL